MFERLRRRFVLITMSSVAVVLICVGTAINASNQYFTLRDLDGLLVEISTNEKFGQPDMGRGGRGENRAGRFDSIETPFSTRWFSITCSSDAGVVGADLSNIAAITSDNLSKFADLVQKGQHGFGFYDGYRYCIVADTETGRYGESLTTGYFLDASEELYQMGALLAVTIVVGIAAFLIVSAVVVLLSRRVIRPIVEADLRQRQFVTDASHELKTPLAIMGTSLKMLELESDGELGEGGRKWIGKTKHSLETMAGLVDELMTLTRVDEEVGANTETFDASALVHEIAEDFRDHALAAGHDLSVRAPAGIMYKGSIAAVRKLVSVLLDNSIRHASPEGAIWLEIASKGRSGITITCANPVEGLDKNMVPHLFDRFYRPDSSRSRESGGFGIGLSIAKGICEAAGGAMDAALEEGSDGRELIRFTATLR